MKQGVSIPEATIKKLKKEAPDYIRTHQFKTVRGIARYYGMSRQTLWVIRKEDPEFDKRIEEALQARKEEVNRGIEMNWKKRLFRGKCTAGEMEFFLTNAFPDEYKSRQQFNVNNFSSSSSSAKVNEGKGKNDPDIIRAGEAVIMRYHSGGKQSSRLGAILSQKHEG